MFWDNMLIKCQMEILSPVSHCLNPFISLLLFLPPTLTLFSCCSCLPLPHRSPCYSSLSVSCSPCLLQPPSHVPFSSLLISILLPPSSPDVRFSSTSFHLPVSSLHLPSTPSSVPPLSSLTFLNSSPGSPPVFSPSPSGVSCPPVCCYQDAVLSQTEPLPAGLLPCLSVPSASARPR